MADGSMSDGGGGSGTGRAAAEAADRAPTDPAFRWSRALARSSRRRDSDEEARQDVGGGGEEWAGGEGGHDDGCLGQVAPARIGSSETFSGIHATDKENTKQR